MKRSSGDLHLICASDQNDRTTDSYFKLEPRDEYFALDRGQQNRQRFRQQRTSLWINQLIITGHPYEENAMSDSRKVKQLSPRLGYQLNITPKPQLGYPIEGREKAAGVHAYDDQGNATAITGV